MKILSVADMALADERTLEGGVSLQQLMDVAGAAVTAFVLRQYPDASRVMVLCGKGNNGGDGATAARLLAREGIGVRVLLAGRRQDLKAEAAQAMLRLSDSVEPEVIEEVEDTITTRGLIDLFEGTDLFIDALFGTGFKGPIRQGAALAIRDTLTRLNQPVVAVDLPSGWDGGSYDETVQGSVRASAVVTFTAPKLAHVFGHLTADLFGPVTVADIGSPDAAVQSDLGLTWTGCSKSLTERKRPINSNKGKFGHVLIVGGSFGTAGAPSMASLACLRAGAGLVTAAVPRELVAVVGAGTPELMVRSLDQGPEGSAALSTLDHLDDLVRGIEVLAVGPGLSTRGQASAFARELIARTTLPVVIDADALNAFDSARTGLLNGRDRTMVLTPHPGEMARLLGVSVKDVEADRINIARAFATNHRVTLVLKGWRTLVAHPDGRVAVNTSGNPALAKGGSGDILTGIIAAMLAQHPDHVPEAVEAAVYLHGLAADIVAQGMDEKAVLATDVIAALGRAFAYRVRDEDGLVWLCGVRSARNPGMREFTREKRFKSRSVAGTFAIAEIIAEILAPPRFVLLRGHVGAGKTTLVQGWLASIGAATAGSVTSPTFTLVHDYPSSRGKVFHLDLYRLEIERELISLGIDEMAEEPGALLLVEWGEKFPSIVQRANAEIVITMLEADERAFWVRWHD